MMIDLMSIVRSPLFGVLLAPLVKIGVDKLKGVSKRLDNASPIVKQSVAVGVSIVGVVAGQVLSNASPDLQTAITAVLTSAGPAATVGIAALGSVAIKHGEQRSGYLMGSGSAEQSSAGLKEVK